MPDLDAERTRLLDQALTIAEGIASTFAPFCEVVVHDLLHPEHSIVALHNNLSGRSVGDPTTERGLARIADPGSPPVIANYEGAFADGRKVKSTSIGIRDSTGRYVASVCLNIDLTLFAGLQAILGSFTSTTDDDGIRESLDPRPGDSLAEVVARFAAQRGTIPRALTAGQRRELMTDLRGSGMLDRRRAVPMVAELLGVSRTTVYGAAK